jgi:hypothetical protein
VTGVRFFVMGGGCYGAFYAGQLLRARAAGAAPVDEIVVVDRSAHPRALEKEPDGTGLRHVRQDWVEFLDERLAGRGVEAPSPGEILVTPPFTPHLALAWLLRALSRSAPEVRWTTEPFQVMPATPYREQRPGGPLLLSHADWICPVNCIEPGRCPKTRGPRYWDMDRTARTLATALGRVGQRVDLVQLFHCHHITYGVGGYPLARLSQAEAALRGAVPNTAGEVRALVGTISHCHGALHLLVGSHGTELEASTTFRMGLPDTETPTTGSHER